jgi:hypothetical protein
MLIQLVRRSKTFTHFPSCNSDAIFCIFPLPSYNWGFISFMHTLKIYLINDSLVACKVSPFELRKINLSGIWRIYLHSRILLPALSFYRSQCANGSLWSQLAHCCRLLAHCCISSIMSLDVLIEPLETSTVALSSCSILMLKVCSDSSSPWDSERALWLHRNFARRFALMNNCYAHVRVCQARCPSAPGWQTTFVLRHICRRALT